MENLYYSWIAVMDLICVFLSAIVVVQAYRLNASNETTATTVTADVVEGTIEDGIELSLPLRSNRENGEEAEKTKMSMLLISCLVAYFLALTLCLGRIAHILYLISKNLELQQLATLYVMENM